MPASEREVMACKLDIRMLRKQAQQLHACITGATNNAYLDHESTCL
jgi:hypothetical protein